MCVRVFAPHNERVKIKSEDSETLQTVLLLNGKRKRNCSSLYRDSIPQLVDNSVVKTKNSYQTWQP